MGVFYMKDTNQNIQEDILVGAIKQFEIPYTDCRANGGDLWIIGSVELKNFVNGIYGMYGVLFNYDSRGSVHTNWKAGWWTNEILVKPANIVRTISSEKENDKNQKTEKINNSIKSKEKTQIRYKENDLNLLNDKLYIQIVMENVERYLKIQEQPQLIRNGYTGLYDEIKRIYTVNPKMFQVVLNSKFDYNKHIEDLLLKLKINDGKVQVKKEVLKCEEKTKTKERQEVFRESYIKDKYSKTVLKKIGIYLKIQEQPQLIRNGYIGLYDELKNLYSINPEKFRKLIEVYFSENKFLNNLITQWEKQQVKKEWDYNSLKKIENKKEFLQGVSISFAEKFSIDLDKYKNMQIENMELSIRSFKRLKANHIYTVKDLLEKTPEQLLDISGFGITSLAEITEFIEMIATDEALREEKMIKTYFENMDNSKINILHGDFSFILDYKIAQKFEEAYAVLGPELVAKCCDLPQYSWLIIDQLDFFCDSQINLNKLSVVFNKLPNDRKHKLARRYIDAYSKNMEKRNFLKSFCPNSETTLYEMLLHCRVISEKELERLEKFFDWCLFDVRKDIENTALKLFSSERTRSIIRAQNYTLEQIGSVFGLTRERIRQIEKNTKRQFYYIQIQRKLVSKLAAEQNVDNFLKMDEIRLYCGEYKTEMVYLFKSYADLHYIYDENLNGIILDGNSFSTRNMHL